MVFGREMKRRRPPREPIREVDPYLQLWRALSPAERLRRSWRLRTRLRDPQAVHDAKTFPRL